jgi:Protein of unknown function (DUF3035)
MNNDNRARLALRLTALAGVSFALIGCQTIREAAGVTKEPPDEFAVVTKAPLVVPPDFNLRPPKPGAAPTNQASPVESAEAALYGEDPATIASQMTGNYSDEEKLILASSGAATSDHSIRQQITADNKQMELANDSLTNQLLFNTGPDPQAGNPVDADAEKERIDAAKTNGQPAGTTQTASTGQTPSPDTDTSSKKPDDSATIKKEGAGSGWFGWLDGIF